MNDLCEKCKRFFNDGIDKGDLIDKGLPWVHCHHDKKKKECWCDRFTEVQWFRTGEYKKANYCPECGRKIK